MNDEFDKVQFIFDNFITESKDDNGKKVKCKCRVRMEYTGNHPWFKELNYGFVNVTSQFFAYRTDDGGVHIEVIQQ